MAVFDLDCLIPFGINAYGSPVAHDFESLGPLFVSGSHPSARSSVVCTILNGARVRGHHAVYLGNWMSTRSVALLAENGVQASSQLPTIADLAERTLKELSKRREQFALSGWSSYQDAPVGERPNLIVFAVDTWSNIASKQHSPDPTTQRENGFRSRAAEASIELFRHGAEYGIYSVIVQSADGGEEGVPALKLYERHHAFYDDGVRPALDVELWERDALA